MQVHLETITRRHFAKPGANAQSEDLYLSFLLRDLETWVKMVSEISIYLSGISLK